MKIFDKLSLVLEKHLLPIAGFVYNQPHLMSIRNGMIFAIPFTIVGSLFLVIASPPIDPNTLNMNAFYAPLLMAWYTFAETYSSQLLAPFDLTMGILSIYIVLGISYSLGEKKGFHPFSCAITGLASFFIATSGITDGAMSTAFFGGTGLITAILVGLLSVELSALFINRGIILKMPEGVPEAIAQSFNSLIPFAVNVLVFSGLSSLSYAVFGGSIPELIFSIVSPALTSLDNGFFISILFGIGQVFWFLGIHDTATVWPILNPLAIQNIQLNSVAYAQGLEITGIITDPFWASYIAIGGSGSTFALVLMMIRSKVQHIKNIGKLGFIPSLFNINEPIIFGLPIFLNPILFIPFILCPMLNTIIAYFAVNMDLVNHTFLYVPWTTPSILSGVLSSLDFRATILTIILIVIDFIIYYPFFKIHEKQQLNEGM